MGERIGHLHLHRSGDAGGDAVGTQLVPTHHLDLIGDLYDVSYLVGTIGAPLGHLRLCYGTHE